MTVHIAIVSEQPVPNVLPLLETDIDAKEVIFLHTGRFTDNISYLESTLKPKGLKVQAELIPDSVAYDYTEMEAIVGERIEQLQANDKQPMINITGGTKLMSLGAFLAAFNRDVDAYYVEDNSLQWVNTAGQRDLTPLTTSLKLDQFLAIHGTQVESTGSEQVPPEEQAVIDYMTDNLDWLIRVIPHINKGLNVPEGQVGHIDSFKAPVELLDYCDEMETLGFLEETDGGFKPTSEEYGQFLVSGWLEKHIYLALRRVLKNNGLKGEHFHSVQITRSNKKSGKVVRNELDVVALVNNHLFVFECKNRVTKKTQESYKTVDDNIYKLNSLKNDVAGARTKAIYVSTYDVKPAQRERVHATPNVELWELQSLKQLDEKLLKLIR